MKVISYSGKPGTPQNLAVNILGVWHLTKETEELKNHELLRWPAENKLPGTVVRHFWFASLTMGFVGKYLSFCRDTETLFFF